MVGCASTDIADRHFFGVWEEFELRKYLGKKKRTFSSTCQILSFRYHKYNGFWKLRIVLLSSWAKHLFSCFLLYFNSRYGDTHKMIWFLQ